MIKKQDIKEFLSFTIRYMMEKKKSKYISVRLSQSCKLYQTKKISTAPNFLQEQVDKSYYSNEIM